MFRKILGAAVTVAASIAVVAPGADAAPAPTATAEHCVQHVTGQKPSGELVVTTPRCYATFEGAMAAEGVATWGVGASERAAAQSARSGGLALLSFTLGTHYDLSGFNPAGGSTSTVGTSCSGGWINASAAWNNRISSTANGCPTIGHYDGANLTGTSQNTTGGGGNLTTLNNITSSIQYN